MKVEPIEHKWLYPEMREMFDKRQELQAEVWRQCRIELGDDLPPVATATEIATLKRHERNPKRRAEIIEAYRQAAQPYADKAAELICKYTAPQAIVSKADSQ